MAICSKCGAQVPDGAAFCGGCGAPMNAPAEQPVQQAEQAQQEFRGYRQQAQQAYGQPQYQQQPIPPQRQKPAFNPVAAVKGFWGKKASAPSDPQDYKFLRLMSLIFAIAFMIFSFGLGGKIYYNRSLDQSGLDEVTSSVRKSILNDYLWSGMHNSLQGLRNAAKRADDYSGSERSNDYYKNTDNDESYRKSLREANDSVVEKNGGFRWFLFRVSMVNGWFLWIGILGMLGSGFLWWFRGGRPGNISQTIMVPAFAAALGFFVLVLFFSNVLYAVSFRKYLNSLSNFY